MATQIFEAFPTNIEVSTDKILKHELKKTGFMTQGLKFSFKMYTYNIDKM